MQKCLGILKKIFPWYGDKVLVATEVRPGNGVDKTGIW